MNRPDPIWLGALQVAQNRMQTIDQALTKLEALVPEDNGPPPTPPPAPAFSPQQPAQNSAQNAPAGPAPLPDSSVQAVQNFLGNGA